MRTTHTRTLDPYSLPDALLAVGMPTERAMERDAGRGVFGPVLRRLRLEAGLSQEALAERARLSVESISALERGRRRAPYRETIRLIADALGLSAPQRDELETAAKRPRALSALAYDSNPPMPAAAVPARAESRQNLVRPLSTFLNRRQELVDLAALTEQHRHVSLIGAGGIGKTRVAIEVGWSSLERFEDGVWFVDLAPLPDHALVAGSLLAALAIPHRDGQDERATLVDHLRGRNALLILDNCEHVADQVASLLEVVLPACPRIHVLATSREPIRGVGERVYRIPPLQSPQRSAALTARQSLEFAAVALFVDRSSAANAGFTYTDALADVVANICRRLDGIALAIELAASRTGVLSPHQIVAELDDHFRILTGGSRTALPRQRTMRETIRWSYDRLDEKEQYLFRRLSVFAGGFTWEAVRAFEQPGPAELGALLDMLTSLVDKSLIVADSSDHGIRYRLLEPMRAYGLEMSASAGEAARTRRQFADWCYSFVCHAHEAWSIIPSPEWSAQVEAERDNLRACLVWLLDDRNDIELGLRIVAAARRIWARLFPAEGRRWVTASRMLIDESTAEDIAAGLALAQLQLDTVLLKYSSALRAASECETYYREAGDELVSAEVQTYKGFALTQLGQNAEGERLMAAAVEAYRARNAKQLIAYGVNYLGIALMIRGDLAAGCSELNEALVLFRDVGNERGAASVAGNLAEAEFSAGNVEAAVRLCREALALFRIGREAQIALANIAAYLLHLGHYTEAREKARESISCGGFARADLYVAIAIGHLAAIAALRDAGDGRRRIADDERAARLVGFVDSRLTSLEATREYTEQHVYDTLVNVLQSRLGEEELRVLRAEGARWAEDRAIAEAMDV